MRSWTRFALIALTCLLLAPVAARAQGMLVIIEPDHRWRLPRPIPTPPQPPAMSYKIKELSMQAKLVDQIAQVQVSQSFVNTGSRQMEVSFVFPLPYDGAIDKLTLMVDGKEIPGKLQDAKQARATYEEIVRRNQDPALLEWIGTGMFQTSVFPVPPGAERKVVLRYNQLCRQINGLTDLLFPLSTAKYTSSPVETVNFQVTIESREEIKNVYSPTHGVEVKRPTPKVATVTYTAKDQIPNSDFRLFYDVGSGKLGANVISYRPSDSEDGFFVLLASPQLPKNDDKPAKTVLFVVDRSGSMSGQKIEQAKNAVKFVLNNLREGDLFNIVAYDSEIQSFRPELEKFNDTTRQAALGFVEGIYAGGGTNINGALQTALNQLKDSKRPNFVLFMTDGLPTQGETNEAKIVENSKTANQVRARLINFGVGYDVNSRLLDRLARANFGQSEYVRPNENLETQVARLYSKISAPVMTDLTVQFGFDQNLPASAGDPINRMFPKTLHDIFEGEQLVVVGRYRVAGPVKVTVKGRVGENGQAFDFPAELVAKSNDESYGFVEKLWAMRRIGDIIDELDLKGHNDELIKELVALSTKHGILTPYTSFLADERTDVRQLTDNQRRATDNLNSLKAEAGASGFAQRSEKKRFQESAQIPAPTAAAPAAPGAFGDNGRGAGFGGGKQGQLVRDLATDKDVVVQGVQNVGTKAFFKRQQDQRWVDSTVTEALEKNAIRVVQFSPEYFELAAKHGKKLSQYLAMEEPILVNLDGQAYQIDVASK